MIPSRFFVFLKGDFYEYLQVWNSFLEIFVSLSLVCLNYPFYFCFAKFGVLKLSRDDFTKFSVLELFWNCQNPLFLWIGSARISRSCYFCFQTWLEGAVNVSVCILFSSSFSFLADPVPFFLVLFGIIRFVGTSSFLQGPWCRHIWEYTVFCYHSIRGNYH